LDTLKQVVFVELLNGSVEWHPVVGAKRIHPSHLNLKFGSLFFGRSV
jgi:hypothetical protein